MSTPETLADKLRELLPKVTPGPWNPGHITDGTASCNCRYIFGNDDRMGAVAETYVDDGIGNDNPPFDEAQANTDLIALAPTMAEQIIKADDEIRAKELRAHPDATLADRIDPRQLESPSDLLAGYSVVDDADLIAAFDELRRAEREIAELKRERDLAVAHDRQPYPTAESYERVCAARTKWQDRAEAAEKHLREIAELARRVNSSGGYTLEERLDRIITLARSGEEPA